MVERLTPKIKLDDSFYDISFHLPYDEPCKAHTHDCVEILFITSGNSEHYINDETMPAYSGSVFFVMPGDTHGFSSCRTLEHFTISCTPELLQFFGVDVTVLHELSHVSSGKQNVCCQLNSQEQYNTRKILNEMYSEFAKSGQLSDQLKFHSLFTLLLAIVAQAMERSNRVPDGSEYPYEIQIKNFIDEHFQDTFSLKKLAGLCHHSVSQLVRKFREHYGKTPIAYQLELRLDHAAILLQNTSLTITEIAYKCGFSNGNYFSKRFHQKYNISPKEFRNRSLNRSNVERVRQ